MLTIPGTTDLTLPRPAPDPVLTALVTLGHNGPGNVPLPGAAIDNGEALIRRTLSDGGASFLGVFHGEGVWDGVTERSTAWLILAPLPFLLSLRDDILPRLALTLGQESIGLVVHDSDFHPESYVCADR